VAGPAARAEREDDRRGHGRNGGQRRTGARAAAPGAAQCDRRRRQLGGEARIETGRHGGRQRFPAERRQLLPHGLELAVRDALPEARVIHVR
jgi:hypothetical protein